MEQIILNALVLFLFFIFGVRVGRNIEKLKKEENE